MFVRESLHSTASIDESSLDEHFQLDSAEEKQLSWQPFHHCQEAKSNKLIFLVSVETVFVAKKHECEVDRPPPIIDAHLIASTG